MRESDIILADELFQLIDDVLDGTPLSDVGPLKGNKLLLCVKDFALFNDKLGLVDIRAAIGSSHSVWAIL
jgi:hypothetical protein